MDNTNMLMVTQTTRYETAESHSHTFQLTLRMSWHIPARLVCQTYNGYYADD